MKKLMSTAFVLLFFFCVPLTAFADGEPSPGSIFDLLSDCHMDYEVDLIGYYLTEMQSAAIAGDVDAGRAAEKNRNELIVSKGSSQSIISFDELYLLSRFISAEAGCDWLPEDFRMCVGEVVLNRVASVEFPDSIYGVIYQKGQYSCATAPGFESLKPSEECVDVALRLLQGERKMVNSVVFQSNTIQGDLFTLYCDRQLGTTYFCVSANQDLYPLE